MTCDYCRTPLGRINKLVIRSSQAVMDIANIIESIIIAANTEIQSLEVCI